MKDVARALLATAPELAEDYSDVELIAEFIADPLSGRLRGLLGSVLEKRGSWVSADQSAKSFD